MFGKCRSRQSTCARKFGVGQWSFIGPGSEKKWYSAENSPQGAWDHIADKMLLEFAESGHPTFRATTPLSRGILKSKGHGKLSIQFAADELTIETLFRIIISVNQFSIYGAVAAICEEFENRQDGSGEPEILMGQSIVLGEIKAEVPLQNENSLNHQILWQQYIERIESLSPESKVSRFCMEAGFMRIVEVGQYFTTKDTGDFRQFRSVACREYTLPRDDPASQPKGWIQGNMRIGLVLEVTTSFKNFKCGIEIRIWSVGQDQTIHRIMVHPGLLKCGKVEMGSTIDRGNLSKILGIHWKELILIVENIFSAGRRILQGTKRLFTIERRDPIQRFSKERLILKDSSWEVSQQNFSIKSGTKCEFDKKKCQQMQRIVPSIQYFGECLWLQH